MAQGPSSSQTSFLLGAGPNVRFTSIATVGDRIGTKSDGSDYDFVGIPDGIGAYDNGDGTLTVLVNHELPANAGVVREHGAAGAFVSRLLIDKNSLAVVSAEDAVKTVFLDPTGDGYVQGITAFNRFCSGDLPEQAGLFNAATGLGSQARIFITGEEAGAEGRGFAIVLTGPEAGRAYELPDLGNFSYENTLVHPDSGDKTIAISMDDSTPGQVYLYVGQKRADGNEVEKAGLTDGRTFGIRVPEIGNNGGTVPGQETSATTFGNPDAQGNGRSLFELVALGNDGDVSGLTGAQLELDSDAKGVSEFFRPEDGHWDPTNSNFFYFVTTASVNDNSRLYRLEFTDVNNPEAGGTIRMLLDGSEGHRMADNMTVNEQGKVIFQEDVGGNPRLGKIWEYDPAADTLTELAQHDPARFLDPTPRFFNQDEESSGIIDVTALIGNADTTAYLLDIQAHYSFTAADADVHPNFAELVQNGQLLAMFVDERFQLGTEAGDAFAGASGTDIFYIDNSQSSGFDTIAAFGLDDLLVTSEEIFDSNNDGVITFGGDRRVDLFEDGSEASIRGTNGKAVTRLEYDGSYELNGEDYFVYSLVRSSVDVATVTGSSQNSEVLI